MKNLKVFYLLPALALFACSDEPLTDLEETPTVASINSFENAEIAFPGKTGNLSEVYFAGKNITVESIENNLIYQGDILFERDMVTAQPVKLIYEKGENPNKSVGRTSHYWPDNIVYYSIDSNLPNAYRVTDAISHWEANTAVKFVKRSSESNYIYFTPGSGCSSYIGMIGGRQNINLASGCTTGNAIHEIGHSIGLWHEQSRVDRDSYISIHYENVQSGTEHNFRTYEEGGYDGDEFTSQLDFGSIMMYGPYSFSTNGLATITKKDGTRYYSQRDALSSGDIEGINSMYPGQTTTPTDPDPTETTTPNPEPEPVTPPVPTYINGEYYTIAGLTVLRRKDKWWVKPSKGRWQEVELVNGSWYFV